MVIFVTITYKVIKIYILGKLTERQGRKAMGLRGVGAYDSQVAVYYRNGLR